MWIYYHYVYHERHDVHVAIPKANLFNIYGDAGARMMRLSKWEWEDIVGDDSLWQRLVEIKEGILKGTKPQNAGSEDADWEDTDEEDEIPSNHWPRDVTEERMPMAGVMADYDVAPPSIETATFGDQPPSYESHFEPAGTSEGTQQAILSENHYEAAYQMYLVDCKRFYSEFYQYWSIGQKQDYQRFLSEYHVALEQVAERRGRYTRSQTNDTANMAGVASTAFVSIDRTFETWCQGV